MKRGHPCGVPPTLHVGSPSGSSESAIADSNNDRLKVGRTEVNQNGNGKLHCSVLLLFRRVRSDKKPASDAAYALCAKLHHSDSGYQWHPVQPMRSFQQLTSRCPHGVIIRLLLGAVNRAVASSCTTLTTEIQCEFLLPTPASPMWEGRVLWSNLDRAHGCSGEGRSRGPPDYSTPVIDLISRHRCVSETWTDTVY